MQKANQATKPASQAVANMVREGVGAGVGAVGVGVTYMANKGMGAGEEAKSVDFPIPSTGTLERHSLRHCSAEALRPGRGKAAKGRAGQGGREVGHGSVFTRRGRVRSVYQALLSESSMPSGL